MYEEQLEAAFDYAVQTGSFDKRNRIQNAKHVCIFGLGKYFEEAFARQNVAERFRVTILSDNSRDKLNEIHTRGGGYKKFKYFLPEELPEGTVVIIMLGDPRSVEKQLAALGIAHMTYNDLALDDVMNQPREPEWFLGQKSRVLQAYSLLEDQESQKIFVNVFCNRAAPHLSDFDYADLYSAPQYFPDGIVDLKDHESILDCGAYTGDTLEQFMEIKGEQFHLYHAMELDQENFEKLKQSIQKFPKKIKEKCCCYPYGVWDKTTTLSYGKMSSSDSFSIYNEKDRHKAEVVAIDDFFASKRVSFIKMDIEGAERRALIGAKRIIQKQHPRMAVCVYHKFDDLWEIPLYLKSLVPEYRIMIRHHAKFHVSETVCYAVI